MAPADGYPLEVLMGKALDVCFGLEGYVHLQRVTQYTIPEGCKPAPLRNTIYGLKQSPRCWKAPLQIYTSLLHYFTPFTQSFHYYPSVF